jgi:hypothetical protein
MIVVRIVKEGMEDKENVFERVGLVRHWVREKWTWFDEVEEKTEILSKHYCGLQFEPVGRHICFIVGAFSDIINEQPLMHGRGFLIYVVSWATTIICICEISVSLA